jgi:hypothetical protein
MSKSFQLTVRRGKSRSLDSLGYPTLTITDARFEKLGNRCFQVNGGGYDLLGTAFGNWLERHYDHRLLVHWRNTPSIATSGGFSVSDIGGMARVTLNGVVGMSVMERYAQAIGLDVTLIYGPRNSAVQRIDITDTRSPA